MSLKRLAAWAIIVFIGITGFVLVSEIVLRIWTPDSLAWKAVRMPDPVLHHALKPSSAYVQRSDEFSILVKTNSLGLRDVEPPAQTANQFRIIVLGDSFVEGHGVPMESCFVKLLERKLNADAQDTLHYVVYNFGTVGYSPLLEYLQLTRKGFRLNPHLVILCYDMTDLQEDVLFARDAVFDRSGVPLAVHPSQPRFGSPSWLPGGPLKTIIQNYSYLYSLLWPVVERMKGLPLFERGNIDAGRYMHTMDSTAGNWERWFAQSESYVKLVSDSCRARGILFALSVHPLGHQVSTSEWREGRKHWGLESRVYNSAIFASLECFAERNSIPMLNMTGTFRRHSKGDLYYPVDGHWTAEGHRVAADTLYEFLVGHHLLRINDRPR